MRFVIVSFALIILSACSGKEHASDASHVSEVCSESGVYRSGSVLCFKSLINSDSVERLKQLAEPKDELFIDSLGGDIASSIELVDVIESRSYARIYVGSNCHSACAQYVLFANIPVLATPQSKFFIHSRYVDVRLDSANCVVLEPEIDRTNCELSFSRMRRTRLMQQAFFESRPNAFLPYSIYEDALGLNLDVPLDSLSLNSTRHYSLALGEAELRQIFGRMIDLSDFQEPNDYRCRSIGDTIFLSTRKCLFAD